MIYKLFSRNLGFGIWDGEAFIGIREKFGEHFLFGEFHVDYGGDFGTAVPLMACGEATPYLLKAGQEDELFTVLHELDEQP